MELGILNRIHKPMQIQMPPIIIIHVNARFIPGSAAGLSGSVAVSICRFVTDKDTNKTIMATKTPIDTVSLVLMFISNFISLNEIYYATIIKSIRISDNCCKKRLYRPILKNISGISNAGRPIHTVVT